MRGIICLTRTLGDVVLGNVLVKNIIKKFPGIELDYVVEENYKPLVEDNPNIKNVIIINNMFEEWDKILKILALDGYDEIFVPQQLSLTDNVWHQSPKFGESHLLNFYAGRSNLKIVDSSLELYVKNVILDDSKVLFKSPTIVMHNTTLVDVKNWSKFNELSSALRDKFGCNIVQLGLPSDKEILGAVRLNLSLKEIMEFFNRKLCDIFIGLDSGLSYVAAAFRVPVVALYGATSIKTSGVYGDTVKIILAESNSECKIKRADIKCHGILGGMCQFPPKCVDNISVESVIKMVEKILIK